MSLLFHYLFILIFFQGYIVTTCCWKILHNFWHFKNLFFSIRTIIFIKESHNSDEMNRYILSLNLSSFLSLSWRPWFLSFSRDNQTKKKSARRGCYSNGRMSNICLHHPFQSHSYIRQEIIFLLSRGVRVLSSKIVVVSFKCWVSYVFFILV